MSFIGEHSQLSMDLDLVSPSVTLTNSDGIVVDHELFFFFFHLELDYVCDSGELYGFGDQRGW